MPLANALVPAGLRHPRELEYIRVTSLKTFESCPYTWAAKYLPPEAGEEEPRTGYAAIGTAVHAICEDFLMGLHSEGHVHTDQLENWGVVPGAEAGKVHKYLESLAEIPVAVPLCVEERFYHRMPGCEGMPPISGQMDFVCETTDGGLLIVDHKTNRSHNGKEWWSAQLQQLLYAWMVRIEYPGYPSYSFRIGYPNLGTYVQWQTEPEDDEALAQRVQGIWARMMSYAAEGSWPRTLNAECGFCPVKSACPEHSDSVNRFRESFISKVGNKPNAEKLEYVKNVRKVVDDMIDALESLVAAEVAASGGEMVVGDTKWTLQTRQSRSAEFMETWQALSAFAAGNPELGPQLEAALGGLFTVKVTALDEAVREMPALKRVVDAVARKSAAEKPTLRSAPVRRAVQK